MNQIETKHFLEIGYKAAVILAFVSLVFSAAYLFYFSILSPISLKNMEPETMVAFSAERRMMLLSTAIFVAMAMVFIGFGLFLIQAKGEVDVGVDKQYFKLTLSRLSPGLFVILCASAIIVICATHDISYKMNYDKGTNRDTIKIIKPAVDFGDSVKNKKNENDKTNSSSDTINLH